MKKIIKNKKGISLLELVIYIGILGITVTAVIGLVYPILKASKKNEAITECQQNSRFVLEKLNQEIGKAISVNQPTLISPEGDILSVRMSDGTDRVFEVQSGSMHLKKYNGVDLIEDEELTTSNITISKRNNGFDIDFFRLVKNSSSKPTININFKAQYMKASEIISLQEFQTTVSLK